MHFLLVYNVRLSVCAFYVRSVGLASDAHGNKHAFLLTAILFWQIKGRGTEGGGSQVGNSPVS